MQIHAKVERFSGIKPEDFESFRQDQDKPFILEGALNEWKALQSWDPPYLRRLLGDTPVKFKRSSSGLHPNFLATEIKEMFAVGESSFSDYISQITEGPIEERTQYLFTGDEQFLFRVRDGKEELNPALAPLWNDVQIPPYVPRDRLYSVWSWFSAAKIKTWLHYDNNHCHNLNAQIRGKKRCLLFAPSELPKLAMFPPDGPNPAHNCSQINIFNPDYERFPEFSEARAYEAEIRQGDLFYLPDEWSHAFEHLGQFNVNVNFWWLA